MTKNYHLLIYAVSYLLFFMMLLLSKARQANRLLDEKGAVSNRGMLLLLHSAGILLLGAFSFYFFDQPLHEIVWGKNPPGDLQVLVSVFFVITALLIVPVLAEKKMSGMKVNRSMTRSFSIGFITNYFFVRVLFLCVYEIWFRGYLLTDCISSWNIPVAIFINIVLYVLLHSVNGKEEMRGCVPFGLLLCGLCIWTGAAWPAIALHIALAVSYEAHLVKRINKPSIFII